MSHRDARALDHKTLAEIRIRAVEHVQAGESAETVIQAIGFSRSCIHTWLARCRAGGWAGLQAKALAGRPMKVTPRQVRWIDEAVTQKNPLPFRFEFALWTRDMVRTLIREEFGLRLSLSSVGRLLAQLGLTCQRPPFRAIEQDAERVARWQREEFPAIHAEARQRRAVIWFGDESGVRSDDHAGTTWGVRGHAPVVPRTGARFSLNMVSVINARGQMRFMVHEGRPTAEVFVASLKRLMHGNRPVFLVLDGHSVHRARLVREYLATCDGRLRLFFLPPYAPQLNPDEQVWNHVKHHGVGRAFVRTKADLKACVQAGLRRIQKSPWLIPDLLT